VRDAAARPVKSWLTPVFASRENGAPSRSLDEHQDSAPYIPVWKTGVYLSTLMLGEMESRAGIEPDSVRTRRILWFVTNYCWRFHQTNSSFALFATT